MHKRFIPSLHFYCDRWCERCTLTQRCEIYFEQSRLNLESEDSDLKNKIFWELYFQKFDEIAPTLPQKGKMTGIETTVVNDFPEAIQTLSDEELGSRMTEYGRNTNVWFELNYEIIIETMSSVSEVMDVDLEFFQDTIEVINWYQHFLGIKFKIASKSDEDEDITGKAYLEGTRKVMLIALDRSITAWGLLLDELPEFENDIFQFVATLTFIRQEFLIRYPAIVNFKRPGFDEL